MVAASKEGSVATKEAVTRDNEIDSGKEAVLAAYSNLVEAKEHFKHAAEAAGLDLKHEATEQLIKGQNKAKELGQQANSFVHDKPLASLGIAFAAGFLISQLCTTKK